MRLKTAQPGPKPGSEWTPVPSPGRLGSSPSRVSADGAAGLHQLQHALGNRLVYELLSTAGIHRKCACGGSSGTCESCREDRDPPVRRSVEPGGTGTAAVQPQDEANGLRVSTPTDASEMEADRVADQILAMKQSKSPDEHRHSGRKEASGVPRTVPGDHARLEQSMPGFRSLPPLTATMPRPGNGRPLDASLREFFEPRFGRGLGAVRIHTDEDAAQSAQTLHARAFTAGQDVFFGHGQFTPDTGEGKKLLAHELAHVIQQSGGSPPAGLSLKRATNPDDSGLEESMGSGFEEGRKQLDRESPALSLPHSRQGGRACGC